MKLHVETTVVGDIPILTISPDSATHLPVVFYIPGYGWNKESGLRLGYQIAQQGFFVISMDPWLHGERYDRRLDHAADPELGGVYPPATGLDTGVIFYRIIAQCLADVRTLMAHFAADSRTDVTRCGVTGMSLGGYASYLVFARVPEVRAAVPMVGVPSFGRRWRDIIDETAFSNPGWAEALAPLVDQISAHTTLVEQMDPCEELKAAAPRALLMMNCDFDFDQPKLYAVQAYRELLPYYAAQPENLQLRIYPAGHTVTPEMERDAVQWFIGHLP